MAQLYSFQELDESNPCSTILGFVSPGTRVLEFGSATGYMTKFMKEELNCKVTCVELIPEMAQLTSQYAEKIIVADIDQGEWEEKLEGMYDCIIFADVLEHLRFPGKALQRSLKYLSNDGCILTSIPNIGHNAIILSLLKGKFEYTDYGLLDDTHVHFFTRKSMCEMFEKKGLICIEEKSRIRRPSSTEFHEFYIKKPLLALSIIRRFDGHVYQFICKWGRRKKNDPIINKSDKGIRLSIFKSLFYLWLDLNDYLTRNRK